MLKSKRQIFVAVFLLCCVCVYTGSYAYVKPSPAQQAPSVSSSSVFIENKGQVIDEFKHARNDIQYAVSLQGINAFIGTGAIHYQWSRKNETGDNLFDIYRLDVELEGANPNAEVVTSDIQPGYRNYYLPQCPNGVTAATCKKITYKNIYPHIDWVLYLASSPGEKGGLKYDFVVHPGGNPQDIRIHYDGTSSLQIQNGELIASTPFGTITENAPYAYDADTKETIDANFTINGNTVGFSNNIYPGGTLVIDPQLMFSSYFGGELEDLSYAITADDGGYISIAGQTISVSNIATISPVHQSTIAAYYDAYIARFYNIGTIQWATYFGGDDDETFLALSCDKSGNIYAGGVTRSTVGIATPGSHQPMYAGGLTPSTWGDGMLAKFNEYGRRIWSTYYGGNQWDEIRSLKVHNDTTIYIAGFTTSPGNISTTGAFQEIITDPVLNGIKDAMLVRFDSAGNRKWGTYFGNNGNDEAFSVATDYVGNIYITGQTTSIAGITTTGSHQPTFGGGDVDAFIAKFNPSGNTVLWASYYGGNEADHASAIAYDPLGYIYIGGGTKSIGNIATPGSHQSAISTVGVYDGFAAKFNLSGSREWGTYYGGANSDFIYSISVTYVSQLYIFGATNSDAGIATPNSYHPARNGAKGDMFFARLSLSGLRQMGSYYGGTDNDGLGSSPNYIGHSLFCHGNLIYFTGSTFSEEGIADSATNYDCHQSYHASAGSATGSWKDGFFAVFEDDAPIPIEILGPFTDTVLCPGDTFMLRYDLSPPPFLFGNEFQAWLSDASGDFSSGSRKIGIRQSVQAGTITCIIPQDIEPGSKYRVHIRSTITPYTSFDNGVNIRIKASPGPVSASTNAPVCEGDSLYFYATDTVSGVSFKWTGPAGYISSTKDSIIASPLKHQEGIYTVTAILDGCTISDTESVMIMNAPKLQSIGSNSPLCEGYALVLTTYDTATGVSYSWVGPNGYISTSKSPQINSPKVASTGIYTVVATIGNCTRQASTHVIIKQKPGLADLSSNSPICAGNDLSLHVIDSTNISVYNWQGPNNFKSSEKDPVIAKATGKAAGMYILTAEHEGCFAKDTVLVTIKPIPQITLSVNSPIQVGDSIIFHLESDVATTYSWTGPDFFSSTEQNPVIFPAMLPHEGSYFVTADFNGCTAEAAVSVDITTPEESFFVLFPNPNGGNFTIRGNVKSNTRINIEVVDAVGRKLYYDNITPVNFKVDKSFTLPGYLPSGVYQLVLRTGSAYKYISFTINK